MSQVNTLFSLCVVKWAFKYLSWSNSLKHFSHLNLLALVCWKTWLRNLAKLVHRFWQMKHSLYFRARNNCSSVRFLYIASSSLSESSVDSSVLIVGLDSTFICSLSFIWIFQQSNLNWRDLCILHCHCQNKSKTNLVIWYSGSWTRERMRWLPTCTYCAIFNKISINILDSGTAASVNTKKFCFVFQTFWQRLTSTKMKIKSCRFDDCEPVNIQKLARPYYMVWTCRMFLYLTLRKQHFYGWAYTFF